MFVLEVIEYGYRMCSLTHFKVFLSTSTSRAGLEKLQSTVAPFMNRHLTGLPGPRTFGEEPPHKEGLF